MNLSSFVQARRPHWLRLHELLLRLQTTRLSRLSRAELKEFGQLYRAVSADLACAQTHFPDSAVTRSLNELVARAHHHIYQSKKLTVRTLCEFYRTELPRLFRRNVSFFTLSASVFLLTLLLGLLTTRANEEVARLLLSTEIIDHIHQGKMWTDSFFDVVPSSLASSVILTNNISVSFLAFALGITFGLGTLYILSTNGLLLGTVLALCSHYGMSGELLAFVMPHGVVEISVILIAGAAGLMLGSALLLPGDLTRRDALTVRGTEGARLVLGSAPLLVLVGIIESVLSPSPLLPPAAKITVGLLLGALLYLYLFRAGLPLQSNQS